MSKQWKIVYYQKKDGSEPAVDFLENLPVKDRVKMLRCIDLLCELGPLIRSPHAKALTGQSNLFELRSKVGSNIQRVLYFYCTPDQSYVLLNGFTKKTNKTPPQEIERAKRYRDDWLS